MFLTVAKPKVDDYRMMLMQRWNEAAKHNDSDLCVIVSNSDIPDPKEFVKEIEDNVNPKYILKQSFDDLLRKFGDHCIFHPKREDKKEYTHWVLHYFLAMCKLPKYDKYIVLEDDIACKGMTYDEVVSKMINDDSDVVIEDLNRMDVNAPWKYAKEHYTICKFWMHHHRFVNMWCMTRRMMEDVCGYVTSHRGHPEQLIISYVMNQPGVRWIEMSEIGVPNYMRCWHEEFNHHKLYLNNKGVFHPIKTMRQLKRLESDEQTHRRWRIEIARWL